MKKLEVVFNGDACTIIEIENKEVQGVAAMPILEGIDCVKNWTEKEHYKVVIKIL